MLTDRTPQTRSAPSNAKGLGLPTVKWSHTAGGSPCGGQHPPSNRRRFRCGREPLSARPPGSPSENQGPPDATGAAGGPSNLNTTRTVF